MDHNITDLKDALENKANNLADRINEITKKFDIADEVTSDDVVGFVKEKTKDIVLDESLPVEDVMILQEMADDFHFGRDTLKSNVKNGRRVLESITLELLDADEDSKASLVMAFAELNKGISENLKVYFNSWKQMSEILVNLDKIKSKKDTPKTVNNTVNVVNAEPISTVDLIAAMKSDD